MFRGKFQVQKIAQVHYNPSAREVTLQAVCNDGTPENERFHRYTPTGTITMVIDNPAVLAQIELGKHCFVDFSPVPSA